MSKKAFIYFLFTCIAAYSFIPFPVKKLIGNWVSPQDIDYSGPGDTLNFEKKKYSYDLFTRGKYALGFEFREDSTFVQYHNVGCSTESDEVFYHDEKYTFAGDSVIAVKGYSRSFSFRVISVNSKKLSIKILP